MRVVRDSQNPLRCRAARVRRQSILIHACAPARTPQNLPQGSSLRYRQAFPIPSWESRWLALPAGAIPSPLVGPLTLRVEARRERPSPSSSWTAPS